MGREGSGMEWRVEFAANIPSSCSYRLYGLTIFCARQQVSFRGMQDDMHF